MKLEISNGILRKYKPGSETELVLPPHVRIIGMLAFDNCVNLTSVVLPEGLEMIGGLAFAGCANLQELYIPDNVRHLGKAFCQRCTSLQTVTMPAGLARVPEYAFRGCTSLSDVMLPEKLEVIGPEAFINCESLEEIAFPDTLRRIDYGAFRLCRSLARIRFPEQLESVGSDAFCGTKYADGASLIYAGPHILCGCKPDTMSVTVPEGVHTIADGAFADQWYLKEVILPSTLRHIGFSAFSGCSSLREIVLPAGMETIGSKAFMDCTHLSSVRIPSSVRYIGSHVFSGTEWNSVHSSGTMKVGSVLCRFLPEQEEDPFDNQFCTDDNDMPAVSYAPTRFSAPPQIPPGVRMIGSSVFHTIDSETLTIPEGVEVIGTQAFYDCINLREIHLPESLTTIEGSAFCGCKSLRKIYIPDNVRYIGDHAFGDNYSLEEVSLPGRIGCIGGIAFRRGVTLRFRMPEEDLTLTLQRDWEISMETLLRNDKGCGMDEQVLLDFLAADDPDKRGEIFPRLWNPSYRRLGFHYMYRYFPETEAFRAYVKRKAVHLAQEAIREEDPGTLSALLTMVHFPADVLDDLIEQTISDEKHELQLILLDHKQKAGLYGDPFSQMKL
ncbi:MAG: leucine-rich repeat domain-containing protein [Oscillospiraceae bacterium]|nr:leucine-rich repeat domain-containing protein [Oscillospiraceae bacterium]